MARPSNPWEISKLLDEKSAKPMWESPIVKCNAKSGGFLPSALGRFGHQTFLDCLGCDADVFHLTVNDHLDTLKVRQEPTFGDTGYMCTDTAFFLGFTTAPNVTSLDGPFSC
jgi:hypothetical protein